MDPPHYPKSRRLPDWARLLLTQPCPNACLFIAGWRWTCLKELKVLGVSVELQKTRDQGLHAVPFQDHRHQTPNGPLLGPAARTQQQRQLQDLVWTARTSSSDGQSSRVTLLAAGFHRGPHPQSTDARSRQDDHPADTEFPSAVVSSSQPSFLANALCLLPAIPADISAHRITGPASEHRGSSYVTPLVHWLAPRWLTRLKSLVISAWKKKIPL
ncbi:hypothetical protein VTI74DRAFT_715 [Chaetomium olivicolor]